MITSILYSSPTFEAVNYNERKVSQGTATLLVAENMGYLDHNQDYTANQMREYLMDYSKRNEHITKAQLHVSFSCKGHEMDNEQLVQFARQWLAEMGYNAPKQPLLIYSHHDTENNHIHVISSRIDPNGQKIAHSHERVRSKAFVDKTLGVDTKSDLEANLEHSLTYKFESVSQWQAVLEASGYDVAAKNEQLRIARNGAYQRDIPLAEVEHHISTRYADKKRLKQLKALLTKYRDIACCKEELQELMKRKFGVDLVFIGSKDKPRGYFVVDHQHKQVYKGSAILKTAELLRFEGSAEKLQRIDAFIDRQLEEHPRLTERQLNQLLRKHYGANYQDGYVSLRGEKMPIKDYMLSALQHNNRVAWLSSFTYASKAEREALCAHFMVDAASLPHHKVGTLKNDYLLETARTIISKAHSIQQAREALSAKGVQLLYHQGRYFAIDANTKSIYDLQAHGIVLREDVKRETEQKPTRSIRGHGFDTGRESAAANREHEVGTHSSYDDFDDERRLKR